MLGQYLNTEVIKYMYTYMLAVVDAYPTTTTRSALGCSTLTEEPTTAQTKGNHLGAICGNNYVKPVNSWPALINYYNNLTHAATFHGGGLGTVAVNSPQCRCYMELCEVLILLH